MVEQTTIRVLRTQLDLWKHVRMLSLPIANLIQSVPHQFNHVRNNTLNCDECHHIQMPYRFEGSMFAVGKHVNCYVRQDNMKSRQYCMYRGMENRLPTQLPNMSRCMCHLMTHHFHWETLIMRRRLQSVDELPPDCLGGTAGMTKA